MMWIVSDHERRIKTRTHTSGLHPAELKDDAILVQPCRLDGHSEVLQHSFNGRPLGLTSVGDDARIRLGGVEDYSDECMFVGEGVVVHAGEAQRTKDVGYDVFESKISIHWTTWSGGKRERERRVKTRPQRESN